MSPFELSRLREKLVAHPGLNDRHGTPGGSPADDAKAAVAAVLRAGRDGAELLFIKRAEREGDPWSGHLAFPGGKREPTDTSLLVTAIRETREEVGLSLAESSLLARLDDVRARTNGYTVAQYVFAIVDPAVTLTPNAEVQDTLWVPLERIVQAKGRETMTWNVGGESLELPCVRLGDCVLWGMTHRMVMQVIEVVRAP